MKFFVKDFCETVQARVVIFGEQVDNDVLYCGIANQPSPAYSSLYLSIFLSLYSFCQRYLHNCIRQKIQIWYIPVGSQRQVVSWN